MDPVLLRLAVVLATVVLTTVVGRTVTARRARLRVVDAGERVTHPPRAAAARPGPGDGSSSSPSPVAGRPGPSALLFGSPTCAPCDTLKRLLTTVGESRADFDWRYVDAADHLDLAREHGVRTVPTLLVLDGDGRVVARTSGVPHLHELERTVAEAAGGATTTTTDRVLPVEAWTA